MLRGCSRSWHIVLHGVAWRRGRGAGEGAPAAQICPPRSPSSERGRKTHLITRDKTLQSCIKTDRGSAWPCQAPAPCHAWRRMPSPPGPVPPPRAAGASTSQAGLESLLEDFHTFYFFSFLFFFLFTVNLAHFPIFQANELPHFEM